MRGTTVAGIVALGAVLGAPLSLLGQQRSAGVAHEITHVVQQQRAEPAVLSIDGARLVLGPGNAASATITLRRVARATLPCRHEGFEQIGDTLVVDGTLRGARGGVRVSIDQSPGRARAGSRLVLVAERPTAASVGGGQTETIGASRTITVGGAATEATADGRYYVTSARHDVSAARIEADLAADGRFRSLHFGWLPQRSSPRAAAAR